MTTTAPPPATATKLDRQTVANSLKPLAAIAKQRSTQASLECVKIGYHKASATNGEQWVSVGLDDLKIGDGLLVNAASLSQIVNSLDCPEIEIEYDGSRVTVLGAGSRFRLPVIEGEHSESTVGKIVTSATTDRDTLNTAVDSVAWAVSREGSRYAINGILIELYPGGLRLVATNGRALAITTIKDESGAEVSEYVSSIVPVEFFSVISKMPRGDELTCCIALAKSRAEYFDNDQSNVDSALVEGTFPDYAKVIPSDLPNTVEIDGAELKSGIAQAALMCEPDETAIRFELAPDMLKLSASTQRGSAAIEIECSYSGGPLVTRYNPRYWLDMLAARKPDALVLDFGRPSQPVRIHEGNTDQWQAVIMPVSGGVGDV